jgi:hypothetical protein
MKSLTQFAEEHGFKSYFITKEEYEDGVGSAPGLNYVKKQVWYTEAQAMSEIGVEIKISCGNVQARNENDARQQAVKVAETAGVKAIDVKVRQFGNSNKYNITSRYVK